ncbi:hypothetical protein [Acidocella sp.]|uniref:hypothetical protein n=1 Tax=Acidocella sp. TaxID=50710 RepID=UPI003CFE4754
MRITLPVILIIGILGVSPAAALADADGCSHQLLTSIKSPDGKWVASVDESDCSPGMGGDAITDTVQVAPANDPRHVTGVLGVDTGGNNDMGAQIAWDASNILKVTLPNISLVKILTRQVGPVKIHILFNPPDPKARADWLKSLDQDNQ